MTTVAVRIASRCSMKASVAARDAIPAPIGRKDRNEGGDKRQKAAQDQRTGDSKQLDRCCLDGVLADQFVKTTESRIVCKAERVVTIALLETETISKAEYHHEHKD